MIVQQLWLWLFYILNKAYSRLQPRVCRVHQKKPWWMVSLWESLSVRQLKGHCASPDTILSCHPGRPTRKSFGYGAMFPLFCSALFTLNYGWDACDIHWYGPCRYDMIRYDTHVHDFQNQEFWTSTTKWMLWVDLYVVNPTNTSNKANWSPV